VEAWGYRACAVIGFIAGVINVIAAGGSFLTLPLLLFLGLPAALANGTNRVGVVAQNVGAIWSFHRHDVIDGGWSVAVSIPALAGAAIGVWAALTVPDVAFRRVLSLVLRWASATFWEDSSASASRSCGATSGSSTRSP
jgi:uncharacterized protein